MAPRKFLYFLLVLLFSISVFGQDTDEAVREKREREIKLLEQILGDAQSLRLPENRALVFARVGSALWQTDEKQARKLFRDAVAEVVAAQIDAQNERANKQYFQNLIYGQSPRIDIINLVAARDAELALEFLAGSRPPAIAEAIRNPDFESNSTIQQYARGEISAEQRLIGLAAEQNPQTALKRVRESIKKGVSYETLNLLRKVHAKDPQAAEELAEELAEGFLKTDFSKYSQTAEAAGYFVSEMGRKRPAEEKALKISDAVLRRLAAKMSGDWLDPKTAPPLINWNCLAVIERFFPDRVVQIKTKLRGTNNQNEESERYTKLVSAETAPEAMLAEAEKFQPGFRNEIYRAAASKFAERGNLAQAEKILQNNIAEEQRPYYLAQVFVNLANQAAAQGKFDEAHGYIVRIEDENQRISAFVNLANSAYQKNPKENQKLAEGFLNQARALIPFPAETQADFNAAALLAAAYAPIEAGESFRLLESMLPTLNEITQANFVLLKFRGYGGVRQGEIQLMTGNNLGIYNLENSLRALKDRDFDRALQFTNGVDRPETRLWLQMHLINENSPTLFDLPAGTRFVKSGG